MVYKDCKFYGPHLSKKDRRLRCVLVFPDGKKQTVSYPKYLMEVHLNRYLEENETIDHIDGNPLNNEIENLQVLTRELHAFLDAKRNKNIIVTCKYCGKKFLIKGSSIRNYNRKDRSNSGYFCSKSCIGKCGKSVQLGVISPTIIDKIVPETYKVKSAQGEILDVEVG